MASSDEEPDNTRESSDEEPVPCDELKRTTSTSSTGSQRNMAVLDMINFAGPADSASGMARSEARSSLDGAPPDDEHELHEIDIMFEIGNNAQPCNDDDKLITLEEMKRMGLTRWCWDMFLQAGRYSYCIQKVVYHLHDTFEQSVVTIDSANSADGSYHSPAYSGYGEFSVQVEVHLKEGWHRRVLRFEHHLSLAVGGDSRQLSAHLKRAPTEDVQEARKSWPHPDTWQCAICLSPVKDVTSMLGYCSHVFHDSCWKQFLESKVSDGEVKICCPLCPRLVQREEIRQSVDEDTFKKFERFEANDKVENDPNLIWCPSPDCNEVLLRPDLSAESELVKPHPAIYVDVPVCIMSFLISLAVSCFWTLSTHLALAVSVISASLTLAIQTWQRRRADKGEVNNVEVAGIPVSCKKCGESACFICKAKWHPGETCEEAQISRLYSWTLDKNVGACPHCRCLIEKNRGCDHMTCRMCKKDFNWSARRLPPQKLGKMNDSFFAFCFTLCLPCCAMWLLELVAHVRDVGGFSSLTPLFDEAASHVAIAGLLVLGFRQFVVALGAKHFPTSPQLPVEVQSFVIMLTTCGIVATCKGLIGLFGPMICMCLYNMCLEFVTWRLQMGKVISFIRKSRLLKTLWALLPYIGLACLFGLVSLLAYLPTCTAQEYDFVDKCQMASDSHDARNNSVATASDACKAISLIGRSRVGMLRRCSMLRGFQGVASAIAFLATCGGMVAMKVYLQEFWRLPASHLSSGANTGDKCLPFARHLALAIPLWMLVDGSPFHWSVRAAISSHTIGFAVILFGIPMYKSQILKEYSRTARGFAAVVALLCLARMGFFVEDIIFIFAGGKALSSLCHLLKLRAPFSRLFGIWESLAWWIFWRMVLVDLIGCILTFLILLLDLGENGERGRILRPALAITTPLCLCLLPVRIIISEFVGYLADISEPDGSRMVAQPTFAHDDSDDGGDSDGSDEGG